MDKLKLLFSAFTEDFSIAPLLLSFFDFSDGETKRLTHRLEQQERETEKQLLQLEECSDRFDAIIGEFIKVADEKEHCKNSKLKQLMQGENFLEYSHENTEGADKVRPEVVNVALSNLLEFTFFKKTVDPDIIDLKLQLAEQVSSNIMRSNVSKANN